MMQPCETCQAQLLEYLYDLLEETERPKVEEHLANCPTCQTALNKAQGQQHLLAAAARMEFPGVQFVAPPVEASPVAEPVVLPLPARTAQPTTKRHWRRWVVAASLLIGTCFGLPAIYYANDYLAVQRTLATQQAQVAETTRTIQETATQLRAAPQRRAALVDEAARAAEERQLRMQVHGPGAVTPGAPTHFYVRTAKSDGVPVEADLKARLIDERGNGSELLPMQETSPGNYTLTVPAQLPVQPSQAVNLVVAANGFNAFPAEVSQRLPVAPAPALTHLTTDKPMYQPGEVVQFRSLTLDRSTLKPVTEPLALMYSYTPPVGGEKPVVEGMDRLQKVTAQQQMQEVTGPDGKPLRGVGAGMLPLDGEVPGGEWTLTVRERNQRFPPVSRKFLVNQYQKPRLNKELDFNRKTYAPGEEVQAWCKATRADGGPLRNQPVAAEVTVDGRMVDARGEATNQPMRLSTDGEGQVKVMFRLPAHIEKGQGSLSVQFTDGGSVETLVRTVPIVVKDLQVEFFPEGGDMVAGLPARVYFQVRTPLGKPAEMKGTLLEDEKPTGIVVETLNDDHEAGVNQGMGRFAFTPQAGRHYQLKIDSPAGMTKPVVLPEARDKGVILRIDDTILAGTQPVKFSVAGTTSSAYVVTVSCRDRQVGMIDLRPGQTHGEIALGEDVAGVCRVTVFANAGQSGGAAVLTPVAERLIYRRPGRQLNVVVRPDRASYVPGQKVELNLETLNENEKPAPAIVGLSVVDKSVLTLADEKTARSMPAYFLLTGGLKKGEDLEYADVLLGPKANASRALDLLLGTAGWRHFVTPSQPDTAVVARATPLTPVAPQNFPGRGGMPMPMPVPMFGEAAALPETPFVAQSRPSPQLQAALTEGNRQARAEITRQQTELADRYKQAESHLQTVLADETYLAAQVQASRYRQMFDTLRQTLVPVLGAILLLALVVAVAVNVGRALRQAMPFYALGSACAVLVLALVFLPHTDPTATTTVEVAQAWPALEEMRKLAEAQPEAALDAPRNATVEERAKRDEAATNGLENLALGRFPAPPGATGAIAPMAMAPAPGMMPGGAGQGGGGMAKEAKDKDHLPLAAMGGKGRAGGFGLEHGEDKAKQADQLARAAMKKMAGPVGQAAKRENENQERFLRQARGPAMKPAAGKDALAIDGKEQLWSPALVVREYAHQHRAEAGETRSDFTETLYWHPVLVFPDGKGKVSFDLCDSVTSFQVTAFAHTLDGRVGTGSYVLDSRLPFTVQPKTPLEVTSSDRIMLPLSVSNNTAEPREITIKLAESKGLKLQSGAEEKTLRVEPEKARRQLFGFQPTLVEGDATVHFRGHMAGFAPDDIRMGFRVVPEGFPIRGAQSDLLEGSALTRVILPANWIKGTLRLQADVYPSTLATLQKGLEGLLGEPNGCFEQTSTTNYPNVLILDYLREANASRPDVEKRARELMERGYGRLTSFECIDGKQRLGYEWFGGTAPAHEALTAYGLMQFRDMARVFDVDREMVKRTQDYLLKQRDGKGGFLRNNRALDTFGRAPEAITNAYIVWALTESGIEENLDLELKTLTTQAETSKDPYFLALVANSLINRAQTKTATTLLERIVGMQKPDGHLDAEQTSITGSGGQALQIETTALAVLAWLKAQPGQFNKPLEMAVTWIGQQRGGQGAFGSTQSTILALKALIAHTKANKKTSEAGELTLLVGDQKMASKKFAAGVADTLSLELPDAEKILKPGENKVRLEISGKNIMPYTVTWSYSSLQPANSADCKVRLSTALARTQVQEGETVQLDVKVKNLTTSGQGMTTAIIGLPGGLTVPEDLKQLKELTQLPKYGSRPHLSAFEIRGREVVLHWRDLAPEEEMALKLDLICRVPGKYTGPASRAYLYYTAENKHWNTPLQITIAAKE